MATMTAAEARAQAERFRKMSEEGDDPRFRALLLQLADEFDQQAAMIEALEAARSQPADATRPTSNTTSPPQPSLPGGTSGRNGL